MAPISANNSNGDESDGGESVDTDTGQNYHHLHYEDIKKPVLMEDPVKDQAFLSMVNRANSSPPLVLPPKKISPPPYSVRYSTSLPSVQSSTSNIGEYPSYLATVPPPPPPQYTPMGYPSLYSSVSQGSTSDSSSVDFSTSDSFTNTFLRGILTSIDSKDPVVAHAWLETLLDAIDLLPPEAIKREIVVIAISKGQLSQSVASRKSSCRLLGKIATKLDQLTVQQEVLPTTLALCQDPEPEVRFCMCRHVGFVSRGVGLDITKAAILPQLVELSNDEKSQVRLAAIETVVHLLSLLDDETCTQIIVPLVIKSCEQAKHLEDESLPSIAHFLGRLCHGLTPNLKNEQKKWFIDFYTHLSLLGVQSSIDESGKPMPDIVPIPDKAMMYNACRRECAFNFPAMVLFIGPQNFPTLLYPIFNNLACDSSPQVRKTLASSLHEVAKLIGNSFSVTKNQISNLFADNNVEVLEAMVTNLVHVIDALARFGVLQFGQSGQYSDELSSALLKCERVVSQTRNWRLHADCLEKFSCLANCISSLTIQSKFIPMLFERMLKARPLPCRTAAARTLLVILRFTIKMEDRTHIMFRIKEELAHSKNCHTRMLFLRLCEMSIALFSRNYFKQHFFRKLLCLSQDPVPNLRLKLCSLLPKLKSLLYLPSDRSLLHHLEDTVKELLLHEQDRDVLSALQTAIDELDRTEMGVDGVPSMDADLDRENERKLREERLIYSMEEQMNKIYSVEASPNHKRSPSRIGEDNHGSQYSSSHSRWADLTDSRRRSESLPPNLSRAGGNGAETLRLEINDGKYSVTKGRFDSPEPSQTYSPDVSLSFRDPVSAVIPSANRVPNPWESKSDMGSGMGATTSITSGTDGSLIPKRSLDQNGSTGIPAAYSMSLENLDPSAKEFLVDAGVTLETTNLLSAASSLPNLTKLDQTGLNGDILSKSNSQGSVLHKPLEGEFSKFMISSEEMMKYEAEYKKASMEIASQDAAVKAAYVGIAATSSEALLPKSMASGLVTTASSSVSRIPSSLPTRQSRSETKTRIPSSPSLAQPKSHLIVNKDATGGLTSQNSSSSPSKVAPPSFTSQRQNSMSAPGPSAGTSGLPKFSFTGKFSSSTDKLQDSFERLAEKWEAKRKNLVNVSTTNAVAYSGSGSALSDETQSSGLTSSDVPSRRSSIMEHKLQTIKQHNIPKRTSLIKAPVQKRLSLSDQMGLVGRQAMERFILPKRKSVNMEVAYDDDGNGEKTLVTTSGESEDEETISNRSNKSSDEDLPPYPNHSSPGSASALPLPPPPPTAEIFDDGMSTYVPPPQTMNSHQRSQSHLVVKPLTSTIPSRFPSKLSFASSSLRHDSQVPHSRDIGTSNSSTEAMIVPSLPSQRPSLPRPKQQPHPRESSLGNYNNDPREPSRSTPTNNPPLLHMHSAPSINLRSHNSPTNRREKQFEETITPANQSVPRRGGIASPDVSGVEGASFVPKFTRLPPPKYRPQPPASRRPQSQQDQYLERGNQACNVVKQHQAKSLSAESILDSNHHRKDGKGSNLGVFQHQSRDGQIRKNSQNSISNGRYSSPNIKRLSQNSANNDRNSRSSSPHAGAGHAFSDNKSPSSPDSLEDEPHTPDQEAPPITIANSIVNRRAASGMRMWSNPARGTRLVTSSEAAATRTKKSSSSRSPSPRNQDHVPEPAPSSSSGNGSLSTNARSTQSKLRRPMASSMSHLPPPSTALNSPRRLAQRNSYGGGPMSAQSSPVKSTYSMIPSQRSNVSSSAGNSRANSPPEQRRRSSHYPNGSSGSQGPKYGGGPHQTSNLPRYPRFQHQSQPQLTTSQSSNRGRPANYQQPTAVSNQSRMPPPPTENQSNLKQPRIPVRGRSSLLAPGFTHRN